MPDGRFDDLLASNRRYAETFSLQGIRASAARGLAVITCIDSRIEPLAMLGIKPGDAKILRNAGARVTPDVLRTLVAAVHFLSVNRVAIVAHTDCAMTRSDDAGLRAIVWEKTESDAVDEWEPLTIGNQSEVFSHDAALIESHPLIKGRVEVGTFVYDVETGLLHPGLGYFL